MIAALLSLAVYLLYILCMIGLAGLVFLGLTRAFPLFTGAHPDYILASISLVIAFALKNFQWVVLLSQVMAILLSLACYLACVMMIPVLLETCAWIWSAAVGEDRDIEDLPEWIYVIIFGVTILVTDMVTSHYMDAAFVSGFFSGCLGFLSHMMAWLLFLAGYLVYIAFMVALSGLVLFIARGAIENTSTWWPELIHTSIVALTFLLLNMIWGLPFQRPASTLVGYLIYIVCSMALTYNLFGDRLLLKTFVISLTFVLVDMFVKISSVSDILAALVGLTRMIAMALMALFFLVALSFVVFMFLHTWAEILLPSARRDYPAGTFVSIVGLTFMAMRTVLGAIPVGEPSILSNMKAGLLGLTDMINDYRGVYMVIRYFTALAIPLLSMESRRILSMHHLSTKAAFMVALGLVLTMPITENSTSTLVMDDTVQQTIASLVNSQIERMDGGIELLTDS